MADLMTPILQKDKVFNLRLQIPEKCANVMMATADDFEEVPSVTAGNIAVVSGLTASIFFSVLVCCLSLLLVTKQ